MITIGEAAAAVLGAAVYSIVSEVLGRIRERRNKKVVVVDPVANRNAVVAYLQMTLGDPDSTYQSDSTPGNLFGVPMYKRGRLVLLIGRQTLIVAHETADHYEHMHKWEYDNDAVEKLDAFLKTLNPNLLNKG